QRARAEAAEQTRHRVWALAVGAQKTAESARAQPGTGNHSVQSRPLAPPQHHPRIAIAGDVPQRAASRCRTLTPTEGLRTHIKKKSPPSPTGLSFSKDFRSTAGNTDPNSCAPGNMASPDNSPGAGGYA